MDVRNSFFVFKMTFAKRISAFCLPLIMAACGEIDVIKQIPEDTETLLTAKEKQWLKSMSSNVPVRIEAVPYMTKEYTPRYAVFHAYCHGGKLTARLHDGDIAGHNADSRTYVFPRDSKALMEHKFGNFWNRKDTQVYFDGVKTDFPPWYKVISKDISDGKGGVERRSERELIDSSLAIKRVLFPNLKKAKFMQIQYASGIGPTFDLVGVKDKIEVLESVCTFKVSEK